MSWRARGNCLVQNKVKILDTKEINKTEKTLNDIKRSLKNHRDVLEKRYKVKEIGVFGSCVRAEQKRGSDIDILVDFEEVPSLLKFINLERYLQGILLRKVDLVRKVALRKELKKAILEEVIYI